MSTRTILVTGGAGFIGSRIVRSFVKQGYRVRVLDNFSNSKRDSLADIESRVQVIVGDVRDKKVVEKAMQGVDAVLHLAAMISVIESIEKPALCDEINRVASEYIVDLCAARQITFVFASSAAVYGNQSAQIVTEGLVAKPISPYGHSKLAVEDYCAAKAKRSGSKTPLRYVCLRCFNVYGRGQSVASAYASVIPKFFAAANAGSSLTLYGEGAASRDFIHVDDVVSAYIAAIENNVTGVFNIGTGKGTTVKELAQMILTQTQSASKIILKPLRKGEILHSACSNKAFMQACGWRPKVRIADAMVAMSMQRDYLNPSEKSINPVKKLLIAMPAYNEGKVIAGVVRHLQDTGFDNVLVVNDCSKDNTAEVAAGAGAFVVSHPVNRGAGAATMTAISYARENGYDFICLIDSDGQHNPKDIEPLLLAAQRNDVVIGSRNVDDAHMPAVRRLANKIGSYVTALFFGVYVTDSQSGFRLLNRRAIEQMRLTFDRFEFASEMFGEIARNKLSVTEVPITVIYTDHSKSKGQSIPNGFRMIARFLLQR